MTGSACARGDHLLCTWNHCTCKCHCEHEWTKAERWHLLVCAKCNAVKPVPRYTRSPYELSYETSVWKGLKAE